MKKANLFWKIVVSAILFSILGIFILLGWKMYNRKYGRYYYSESIGVNCEEISYYDGRVKIYNYQSKKVTTPKLDWVASIDNQDTTTVFCLKGKRGYLNLIDGEIMIAAQYDRAWLFSEGVGGVIKNNRLGFINTAGEVVIPFKFPYLLNKDAKVDFLFKGGYCTATGTDGKHGLIDKKGNWVIKPEYDYIVNPVNGFRTIKKGALYGVLDSRLEWIIPVKYERIKVSSDGFVVLKNEDQQLLAFDGKTLLQPFVYDETKELHYNSRKVNKKGEDILIRCEYTAFKINEKWGIMDQHGKVIIKAHYSDIEAFSKELFTAKIDDFGITLNTKGESVY